MKDFSLQVPDGWSISNIQCISLNCSDITWGTVASGIEILNLQGQRIFELPASEGQGAGQYTEELNLDHLPLGMYLISLSTGTDQRMTRLAIHG